MENKNKSKIKQLIIIGVCIALSVFCLLYEYTGLFNYGEHKEYTSFETEETGSTE